MKQPIAGFRPGRYPNGDVLQFFGENHLLYNASVCVGTSCLQGHDGWDIAREYGQPIFAVEDGWVGEVNNNPAGYGKDVRLFNDHAEWVYGHMSTISVKLGQQLKAGDEIGKMGNTGFVVSGATPYWKYNPYAGTHLHLGYRPYKLWTNEPTWGVIPNGQRVVLLAPNDDYFGYMDLPIATMQLEAPFYEDFGLLSSSYRVYLWQKILQLEGIADWELTQFFGLKTFAGTKLLQAKYGISPTGYVGPITRAWANAKYPTLS